MSDQDSALVKAAKKVGKTAGNVAKAAGVASEATPAAPPPEDLYTARYVGSGTFIVKKPKRTKVKKHQSMVKSRVRGARK